MCWNISSWVLRCGNWIIRRRRRRGTHARQQFHALRYEHLARVMLTTYYLSPTATTWDTSSQVWTVNGMSNQVWTNGSGNTAVIEGANAQTTITVAITRMQAGAITIGPGGPYTLLFPQGISYQVSGGTVSLPSQSSLTIDVVESGGTVNVTSTIVGSGARRSTALARSSLRARPIPTLAAPTLRPGPCNWPTARPWRRIRGFASGPQWNAQSQRLLHHGRSPRGSDFGDRWHRRGHELRHEWPGSRNVADRQYTVGAVRLHWDDPG